MRRGVKEFFGRIWKGFHFPLSTPSVDWQKIIGGKKLGASFGLIIKNEIDIKIGEITLMVKLEVLKNVKNTEVNLVPHN